MRIAFVHSSRETFHGVDARVRIGSGPENDLVLTGAGVAPRHLVITEDRRGLVMDMLSGAPHVYVNARPVRARALLRHGDHLNVGGHKLLLLPEAGSNADARMPPAEESPHAQSMPGGPAGLRAVSGAMSGKLVAIGEKLELGGHGMVLPGISGTCQIRTQGGDLLLDAHDSGALVNGLGRKHLHLRAGDQLVLGEHRFVVEAPESRVEPAPKPEPLPPPLPALQEPRTSRAEFGWLLGTAALLAVIIALLLWWRH
ncbi:MAG: FHA domain-containing protein [Proteobacteria bacterium]|nr:FHA domain-containing protein [Pseudomonadota bacterium]